MWPSYAGQVNGRLDSLKSTVDRLCDESDVAAIGTAVSGLCDQLVDCARAAFKGCRREQQSEVGWWDAKCQNLKDQIRRGWKRCRRMNIMWDRELRRDTEALRKMVRRKRLEYRVKTDLDMATEMRKNPRAFWSKVKKPKVGGEMPGDIEGAVTYFTNLLNVYHGDGGEQEPYGTQGPARMPRIPDNMPLARAASIMDRLNGVITKDEVIAVLLKLSNNKSTSDGHIRAEMLKFAKIRVGESGQWNFVLAEVLARIFNLLFAKGLGIPEEWKSAFIVPLWKRKGSRSQWTNYRGISLVTTLYKTYAMVLEARMSTFCDAFKLRAVSQCGFRKRLGTTSALFGVHHIIQKTCTPRRCGGKGAQLHVMFVDFRKAFDCVCRKLLWKRLSSLGIGGNMLLALQKIYEGTKFQIKIGGKISSGSVVTVTGVKQGCPLSPILFGLFIEELHQFLRDECPDIRVVVVDEEEIKDLMYADDVSMMATRLVTCRGSLRHWRSSVVVASWM